jgi:outer membrane protein insertion porin family
MSSLKLPLAAIAALCLAVVCSTGSASAAAAPTYTLKNLVFDGTVPYSQQSLEAATGLKPGDTIDQKGLEAVSQKLIDTGAFDDLQARFDGPYKAITIIFKIKPADPSRLLTAGFENFVWFTPEELTAELQKRVPLFNGTVPEAGNEQQVILDALTQMLAAKGIAAKITVEPIAPSPAQPVRVAEFRVEAPSVRIHSITLTGVTPSFATSTNKVVQALTGMRYNEGLTAESLPSELLVIYKNAGYQAASLSGLTRTVVSSTGNHVDVDVAATIAPGDIYRLSTLDWPGSPVMSAQEFTAVAKLHPGDVVSQRALLESLNNLEAAYHARGYMDVAIAATPKLDTDTHQISFTISVTPGAQYTLKSVTPQNLSAAQLKDFDLGWRLHPGDIYNENYVATFLKNNTALRSLEGYSLGYKIVADPDNHTIDLTVTFDKSARQ